MKAWRATAACIAAMAVPGVHGHGNEPRAAMEFQLPPAGSYALAPIQPAPDGEVLDRRGVRHSLAEFTRARITLLGLVYTRCTDTDGCPRATWAFSAVRNRVRGDPELKSRVRFVTLSFDPVNDTPATLAAYAAQVGGSRHGPQWHFLTTRSREALQPILDGFGQDLRVAAGSNAVPGTEAFSHTLKAFLIDARGEVREIYSSAYLLPGMIVNDMRTLAREAGTIRSR